MTRTNLAIFLTVGYFIAFSGAMISQTDFQSTDDEFSVTATFYPLYTITDEVAGDAAEVETVAPAGAEPHGYDPTPSDMASVEDADVYIATGVQFEQWEDEMIDLVEEHSVVEAGSGIELIEARHSHDHDHGHDDHSDEDEHNHEDEHHEEHGHEDEHHEEHHHEDDHDHEEENHGHDHGDKDPHYWVSPQNAVKMAENVEEGLSQHDPENAQVYQENLEDFRTRLEDLDQEYEQRLSECEQDKILTTHAAFAYLGNDYGFEQIPMMGLSPTSEPSPGELDELVQESEEHGIDYVFYEEAVDSRVAKTLAEEADAEVLTIDPVTGALEDEDVEGYIETMEHNLENLEVALECQ